MSSALAFFSLGNSWNVTVKHTTSPASDILSNSPFRTLHN